MPRRRPALLAQQVATIDLLSRGRTVFGAGIGSLVEAVNVLGSLFYGSMLGVFVLAFFAKRVDGTGAFWGVLLGQAAIFAVARYTPVAYLWYNVVGCLVVVAAGLAISAGQRRGTLYT